MPLPIVRVPLPIVGVPLPIVGVPLPIAGVPLKTTFLFVYITLFVYLKRRIFHLYYDKKARFARFFVGNTVCACGCASIL